jgi:GMP synthase (glutamine-hydrolysing)
VHLIQTDYFVRWPESVHEEGSPRAPQIVFELGVPVLGICYGLQTMSEQLGGK